MSLFEESQTQQSKELALSRTNIASALAIGTIALLMLGVQPILLGALVEGHNATLKGIGAIAMSEVVALGVGVALSDALLPLSRLRSIGITAALFTAMLDAATVLTIGDVHLTVVRSAAGLGEGVLLWLTTCAIVRSSTPERITGIFLVVQTLAQAALAATYATLVVPRTGWQGGYLVLAVLTLVPCVAVAWLPPSVAPLRAKTDSRFRWSLATALPPVIVFLQMAAIGALWAYLEPLGKRAGFDPEGAQAVIAGVLVMQVLGGTSASFAVRRIGAVRVLTTAAILLGIITSAIHLLPFGASLPFSLLCATYGFAWLFLMPFQVNLAFRVDPAGGVAMLIPAMQLLGTALGPFSASLLIRDGDVGWVPLVSAGFALTSATLLVLGRSRFRLNPDAMSAILAVGPGGSSPAAESAGR